MKSRTDIVWAGSAAALVAAAAIVPWLATSDFRHRIHAAAAPLFGAWNPHAGWGTAPAIVCAGLVIGYGCTIAHRLPWRRLLVATWLTNLTWTVSLVFADSSRRGFGTPLADSNEYLHDIPRISGVDEALRDFSSRILDFQPDSWTTHVSGHPPGAFLTFVFLDRIGLGGPTWAGVFVVVSGSTAVMAVLVAVRTLGDEPLARSSAPFLSIAPLAIWVGTSADGWFLAVTAWGIALLAVASTSRNVAAAVASGVLLGIGVYLNYGLVLMGVPALAILWSTRTFRPLVPALAGAGVVAAAFTVSGFWWFDGFHLVVERYYQGIASERPYRYWVWANLAAAVCSAGIAAVAGLHRARPRGARILPLAAVVTIALADVSALSKAETERIWLSFLVWLIVAAGLLPYPRRWLLAQAFGALAINHLILTNW